MAMFVIGLAVGGISMLVFICLVGNRSAGEGVPIQNKPLKVFSPPPPPPVNTAWPRKIINPE
jgi:hypothetical protein